MRSQLKNLPLIFMFFSVGACAPAYVPNVVNSPMLSNKGEIQAALHYGSAGFDAQAAYAISNHIGIIANGSFANFTSDSTQDYHRHNFGELGAGYYSKIGHSGRYEVYGGFGLGNTEAEYSNSLWTDRAKVNYTRAFLRPGIGVATDYFDGSLSPGFVMVNMKQDQASLNAFMFEPVITGKIGYQYAKLVVQAGFSIPLGEDPGFNYNPFMFSMGLQATLNRLFDY